MTLSLWDFFEYDFLQFAFFGTLAISFCCGLISPLVVAKRYAFIGSAVSHSTLFGLSIALSIFSLSQPISIYFTTLILTLFLILFLARATYRQLLPADSLIGIFFTFTMGMGILIHTLYAKGQADLLSFLFGNILLLTQEDLILSYILLTLIAIALIVPFKRWIYFTYDEEGALVAGEPVKLFHYGFYILLAVLIVSSIKIAGTILINTLLLVPGVFALKIARTIKSTFIYSTVFSVSVSIIGLYLANLLNLPSGATLAVTQFLFLMGFLGILKLKST